MENIFFYVVTIAAGVFLFEWVRGLHERLFGNTKKIRFKAKLKHLDNMSADLEFTRFQKRCLREDIRKEFDRMNEVCDALTVQIKASQGDTRKELEERLEKYTKDVEGLRRQMQQMDAEISCTNSEMEPGLDQQIEQTEVLKGMLRDYIKTL